MIQRVNGSLAVSRALGDFEYKNVDGKGPTEQLVSPEPGMSPERGHEKYSTLTLENKDMYRAVQKYSCFVPGMSG